jgi:hypothetical protein
VKNRFQNLPFKFNLQRYTEETKKRRLAEVIAAQREEAEAVNAAGAYRLLTIVHVYKPHLSCSV